MTVLTRFKLRLFNIQDQEQIKSPLIALLLSSDIASLLSNQLANKSSTITCFADSTDRIYEDADISGTNKYLLEPCAPCGKCPISCWQKLRCQCGSEDQTEKASKPTISYMHNPTISPIYNDSCEKLGLWLNIVKVRGQRMTLFLEVRWLIFDGHRWVFRAIVGFNILKVKSKTSKHF